MFDPDTTIKQVITAALNKWGTSEVLIEASATIGWNAQWMASDDAKKATEAARLLARAIVLIQEIEKKEMV